MALKKKEIKRLRLVCVTRCILHLGEQKARIYCDKMMQTGNVESVKNETFWCYFKHCASTCKCFFFFSYGNNIFYSFADFIDLPYCSSPDSYRLTEKVADNLLFHGQWNPNQCNCRQQCKKLLFTSSLESTTDRYSIKSGRSKARVRVYYQVSISKLLLYTSWQKSIFCPKIPFFLFDSKR